MSFIRRGYDVLDQQPSDKIPSTKVPSLLGVLYRGDSETGALAYVPSTNSQCVYVTVQRSVSPTALVATQLTRQAAVSSPSPRHAS